ncbi:sulfur oxidation c-type cytochrome SoxA [Siccirubricoccus sp. KC 17139]|uniref:L-cysteine S-thiosulfotransferase subunit SoxA n=1 Tax=Siccirubricoccus soli TaxID=2899147 RepID=A0ABT1CZH3_9PROT|nr:sulfur oxidation c-type cytochrome SoxA [Siccirubricoccus soli]MCO6415059.1 sulfur oxidation c-type cytochrome SoxA [Siccirubricoccus soli]MCP2681190.1 sulfur oxidation c-type cytochrome SoxA [Siccirubricoccus soli]
MACILLLLPLCLSAAAEERRSGFQDMAPETQAMQQDDTANPGMLWVLEGETLWNAPAGPAGQPCAGCHGSAESAMRGVAARYPAWDEADAAPIDLAGRIQQCRAARQGAPPLPRESEELLALTAYVARQSRGLPITPPEDPRLDPARAEGRALYTERRGQLDLSCAQCHDENAGRRLAGSAIPQAHPTGYPLYRLEWQSLGSLQRRLRGCMTGVRAEPYAYGALEYVAIELYLAQRAAGMTLEAPAVRP